MNPGDEGDNRRLFRWRIPPVQPAAAWPPDRFAKSSGTSHHLRIGRLCLDDWFLETQVARTANEYLRVRRRSGGSRNGGGGAGFNRGNPESAEMIVSKRAVGALALLFMVVLYVVELSSNRQAVSATHHHSTSFMHRQDLQHPAVLTGGDNGDEDEVRGADASKAEHTWLRRSGEYIALNPDAEYPNSRRQKEEVADNFDGEQGTRSEHYGEIQLQRQAWLTRKMEALRSGEDRERPGSDGDDHDDDGDDEGGKSINGVGGGDADDTVDDNRDGVDDDDGVRDDDGIDDRQNDKKDMDGNDGNDGNDGQDGQDGNGNDDDGGSGDGDDDGVDDTHGREGGNDARDDAGGIRRVGDDDGEGNDNDNDDDDDDDDDVGDDTKDGGNIAGDSKPAHGDDVDDDRESDDDGEARVGTVTVSKIGAKGAQRRMTRLTRDGAGDHDMGLPPNGTERHERQRQLKAQQPGVKRNIGAVAIAAAEEGEEFALHTSAATGSASSWVWSLLPRWLSRQLTWLRPAVSGGAASESQGKVTIMFPERSTDRLSERPSEHRGLTISDRQAKEVGQPKQDKKGALSGDGEAVTMGERLTRLEIGAELWEGTYVPPIEAGRRQQLIDKWSGQTESTARKGKPVKGRILYVISSFDRGRRLGRLFRDVDKLDYVLMMLDEMREACEEGFSPHVHFIAAWDPSGIEDLVRDRLYCDRISDFVPFSYEEHPPSIGNLLSIKHRIFMKPRVEDFDVFLQVEDDMILTLNHIMLYQEESERLEYRKGARTPADYRYVPGYVRVEPGHGKGLDGRGEEFFEWEILLSRIYPILVKGAGTYIALHGSKILKKGGNNQGMWMANQGQLKKLAKQCGYLNYSDNTLRGHVETHSGSIQMFSKSCGFEKVFPASHLEDFLVHHRTNNKNGKRGESIPAVPVSMLRVWADQFLRDSSFLVVNGRRRLRR